MKTLEEQIELFLSKKLPEEEYQKFVKRIQANPALQEEVELQKKIYATIYQDSKAIKEKAASFEALGKQLLDEGYGKNQSIPLGVTIRSSIEGILNSILPGPAPILRPFSHSFSFVIVSLLVIIGVVRMGIFLATPSPSYQALAINYLAEAPAQIPLDLRRSTESMAEELTTFREINNEAIDFFNKNQYEAAVTSWLKLEGNQYREEEIDLYIGVAYLYQNKLEEAKAYLQKGDLEGNFTDQFQWYLLLTYAKLDQLTEMESIICAYEYLYQQEKVKTFQKALDLSCK